MFALANHLWIFLWKRDKTNIKTFHTIVKRKSTPTIDKLSYAFAMIHISILFQEFYDRQQNERKNDGDEQQWKKNMKKAFAMNKIYLCVVCMKWTELVKKITLHFCILSKCIRHIFCHSSSCRVYIRWFCCFAVSSTQCMHATCLCTQDSLCI